MKDGRKRFIWEIIWFLNLDLIKCFLLLYFGSICFLCEILFEENCLKLNVFVFVCVFLIFC